MRKLDLVGIRVVCIIPFADCTALRERGGRGIINMSHFSCLIIKDLIFNYYRTIIWFVRENRTSYYLQNRVTRYVREAVHDGYTQLED